LFLVANSPPLSLAPALRMPLSSPSPPSIHHKPQASAPTSINLASRPPSQDEPPGVGGDGGSAATASGGGFVPTPPEQAAAAAAAAGGARPAPLTAPGDPCPLEGCPIETFSFVDVVIARGKAGVRKVSVVGRVCGEPSRNGGAVGEST
jgi:hypothetical protein